MYIGKMKRVLIVDDDEECGDQLAEVLTGLGYVTVSCDDPSQALNLFEDGPDRFDVVIIDEVMPKTTGIQLASLLSRIRNDVPMILLTARGDQPSARRSRPAGFRTVLTKPVSKDEIKDALAKALADGLAADKRP